jgi:hypothetical protein
VPSITSWRAEIDGKRFSYIPVVERKFFKNNNLKASISARGGLEPAFRVLFSAIFHGVSLENFHQSSNLRKGVESKL